MKSLLIICLASPITLFSQDPILADIAVVNLSDSTTGKVMPAAKKKDTLNVTDSLGLKQGHWIILGGDFPNSGVSDSEILEDGSYKDGQRSGLWYRYGSGGQVKAVMSYKYDPKTKTSGREQFYYYERYPNGNLKRKPVIGFCNNRSDYYQYAENGDLLEAELFDSVCNTSCKLQKIQKGEMDSISIFIVGPEFHVPTNVNALAESQENLQGFDQTGEYCVDYNHRVFRVGTYKNGVFINGREFWVDEMMRAERVRYYDNGKVVKTLVK